jgi:Ni2+-binding GTPase involved in maturation of urease and hydrogenase
MSEDQLKKLLADTLLIIQGTSKKGRDYEMAVVKNDVRFNNFAIDLMKKVGVQVVDVREKAGE